MDQTPAISLHGVAKTYPDGTVAVHELSFEVPRGRIAALVGPSGCGKTTTMRMINRLIEPTSGEIRINGSNILDADAVELRRSIGYVIQQVGLFPHRTIEENVGTACALNGWDPVRTRARVAEMLELVGLDPSIYGQRFPHQLSGGQRQRVGVARALAADPPVVLMDEPFGAVDPVARGRLQEQFLALQRQLGTTVVLVTHDIDEAVMLGDRLAVMREGGYLDQYAEPGTVLREPATPFVADFVVRTGPSSDWRSRRSTSRRSPRPGSCPANRSGRKHPACVRRWWSCSTPRRARRWWSATGTPWAR